MPGRLSNQVRAQADRHRAALGAEANRFRGGQGIEYLVLDAVAQVVVGFIERGNGDVKKLGEFSGVVSAEPFCDVARRRADGVSQLIAELEIRARFRRGKKCQHPPPQFRRLLKYNELPIGLCAHTQGRGKPSAKKNPPCL
ncbi:MAG TPA: hypothetical protein VL263_18540 [Vicinamibacterales bacterium]|nr:hypothetical protein [Vicinamibacterales bacterium]